MQKFSFSPGSAFRRSVRLAVSTRAVRAAVVGVAMLSMAAQSWAWGREGHRITALVAERYLTPETKSAVAELLKSESLADVAPWADDYRSNHPETAPWHYVDIPKGEAKFDRDRDCPVSKADPKSPWRDCITDRILYFEGRLGDTSLPPAERAIALKFLVHLMGDIHQPFHAMGDDRGGNGISVAFLGSNQCGPYKCNLHGVWDDSMIEHKGLSETKYTDLLVMKIVVNRWESMAGGSPAVWAEVSHHYAVQAYAPNGALLTREYVDAETNVVDAELALGGLRLARAQNRVLGTPDDAPGRTALPKATVAPKP